MSETPESPGIVYILVNERMPDIVKIGRTTDLQRRLRDLDTTCLPMPFDVHHASRVRCMRRAERLLHQAFADRRVRRNREFFEIDPDQATSALLLAEIEDVTDGAMEQALESLDDQEDRDAVKASRRRSATFSALDIPAGTQIALIRNPSITAVVSGRRTVEFEGEDYSLSTLTLQLLNTRFGKNWQSANGWEHWSLGGERLSDTWRRHCEETEPVAAG